jgi:hypothetical protein
MPRVLLIVLSSVLVMSSAAPAAADYLPDEFLTLDLSKAVLSPTPLGPANTFGPVVDRTDSIAGPRAHAKPALHAGRTEQRVSAVTPRGTAPTRLAHHHRNLLDAQAMDTRIQAWPCKSGALCKWKQ